MAIVRCFMLVLALGITMPLLTGCGGGGVTSEGNEPEVGEFAPPRAKAMEEQQQGEATP